MEPPLVLRDNPVLESVTRVPGVEMHLADSCSVVTLISEQLWPCPDAYIVVITSDRMIIIGYAISDGVHARQKCCSSRNTNWRGRISVAIESSVLGKGVDIWSLDKIRSVTTQKIGSHLVWEKENDVGLCRGVGQWCTHLWWRRAES